MYASLVDRVTKYVNCRRPLLKYLYINQINEMTSYDKFITVKKYAKMMPKKNQLKFYVESKKET